MSFCNRKAFSRFLLLFFMLFENAGGLVLKMIHNPLCKCEKTSWKRLKRWVCFWMVVLMVGTSTFILYKSTLKGPQNFTFDAWFSQFHNTSLGTWTQHLSQPERPASDFFVAYPHRYRFILDEPIRCRQEQPFVVVMVPVAPHNREARDYIRYTWAQNTAVLGPRVSHYFLLGVSEEGAGTDEDVLEESQMHHDIIQSDFVDSYHNLTIKTMVMFEWLISRCPKTPYGMKVDSDTFLNIPALVNLLLNAPKQRYFTGAVMREAPVIRDHTSKWFLPYSVFPEEIYPPYTMGLGYVFSLDLPKQILEAAAHVKAIKIEDVYVGLCLRHLGIALRDPPYEGMFMDVIPLWKPDCFWTSGILILLEDSNQLPHVWRTYRTQREKGCS